MTEEISGSHWRWSCRLNRALGGPRHQPLCARAWLRGWRLFIECMALAFRDPCHCEDVFLRWQAAQPISGRTGAKPGY